MGQPRPSPRKGLLVWTSMEIGLHGDKGQSKRVLKSLPSGKDSSPPQGAHTPMTQFPRSTETKGISHPRGLWAILGKGNGARQPS